MRKKMKIQTELFIDTIMYIISENLSRFLRNKQIAPTFLKRFDEAFMHDELSEKKQCS